MLTDSKSLPKNQGYKGISSKYDTNLQSPKNQKQNSSYLQGQYPETSNSYNPAPLSYEEPTSSSSTYANG
jgi:hypothetical protein